ncbi:MAG TPA: aminodeoxychorismate/anthranilate synthase component II [Stellaceae bacterium]|nr:aminodeoxychorismate/anthranilate synthase component II [Stellaceae bacterium]
MRAVLIDAYDSFVHIIRQYLVSLGHEVVVRRNDLVAAGDIQALEPDYLVLGPGPGHPADAGYVEMIRALPETLPILGVCLGHQAIGLAFGARVARARRPVHGKPSAIAHDGIGCFAGHASPFAATRYHSLVVEEAGLPEDLIVTARSGDDGHIMGLRHRRRPIESVQFHPESIGTGNGIELFHNFIRHHVARRHHVGRHHVGRREGPRL